MNYYALPSIVTFIIVIGAGISAYYRSRKTYLGKVFLLFSLFIAYWAFTEYNIRQAHTIDDAYVWLKIGSFLPFTIPLLLHFFLVYTRKWEIIEKHTAYLVLYSPAIIFSLINLRSDVIGGKLVKTYWGWRHGNTESNLILSVFLLWCLIIILYEVYVCARYYQLLIGNKRKNFQKIMLWFCGLITLAFGAYCMEHFYVINVPELTNIIGLLVVLLLYSSILHYTALATPADVADEILTNISESVFLVGDNGDVIRFNKAAEQLTGYDEDQLTGEKFDHLLNADIIKKIELEFIKSKKRTVEIETAIKTRNGTDKPVLISFSVVYNKRHEIFTFIYVLQDLTHKIRAEQELEKVQRLNTLELIVGGVAHDLNNLFTAISANLSLAQMEKEIKQKDEKIYLAEKTTYLAADLARQLYTVMKSEDPKKEYCILENIIQEACALSLRGTNVKPSIVISDELRMIEADRSQIMRVFINLFINARQAMPTGGAVKITAENVTYKNENVRSESPDNFVKIQITDEGTGIPEKIAKHIFDPFFTTKRGGSGLGLAIVKSVVNNHKGNIEVCSKEGSGTTFTLYLPAMIEKIEIAALSPHKEEKRSCRILLMDDDDMVRKYLSEMLVRIGFEVVSVCNGAEAIELYMLSRFDEKPFHLVILDLTVANGLGGKDTLRRLREIDPKVKAIICSGYSYDDVVLNYRNYGFCGAISKPASLNELCAILDGALS